MPFLLKSKKFQLGFTLIELLIVVTIIVILIAIGAVSYSTVNRDSRDAQRKSDLKKIQLALEQFYADNHSYPDEGWVGGGTYDRVTCGTKGYPATGGQRGNAGIAVGSVFTCNGITYLSKMPADPLTGLGYYYESDDTFCNQPPSPQPAWSSCQKYTFWARLENSSDPQKWVLGKDAICDAAALSATPPPLLYQGLVKYGGNYCVHN